MVTYYFKKFAELDNNDILDISNLFQKSFPNSVNLDGLMANYKTVPFLLFLARSGKQLLFVSLVLPKHPTVYLYYVCVNPEYRGNGVFKNAFKHLRRFFLAKGFTTFALDASEEDNVPPGMTQAKRLQIFNRLGFYIVPSKNPSPFVTYTDTNTYVVLDDGNARLLGREGSTYEVFFNGATKHIKMEQIKGCVDNPSTSTPGVCPMQTVPVKRGGSRKRRRRAFNGSKKYKF
jgi:ribosomal protein S18 acetylase RimI-like enzyme